MTVVRVLGTRLIDRHGRVAVLRVSGLVSLSGLLLFGLGPNLVLAGIGVAAWGLGAALAVPIGLAAASDDPLRAAGRVSVVSAFASMAHLAAPPLLGVAAETIGARHALLLITGGDGRQRPALRPRRPPASRRRRCAASAGRPRSRPRRPLRTVDPWPSPSTVPTRRARRVPSSRSTRRGAAGRAVRRVGRGRRAPVGPTPVGAPAARAALAGTLGGRVARAGSGTRPGPPSPRPAPSTARRHDRAPSRTAARHAPAATGATQPVAAPPRPTTPATPPRGAPHETTTRPSTEPAVRAASRAVFVVFVLNGLNFASLGLAPARGPGRAVALGRARSACCSSSARSGRSPRCRCPGSSSSGSARPGPSSRFAVANVAGLVVAAVGVTLGRGARGRVPGSSCSAWAPGCGTPR